MKKILSILLAALMLFSLASCTPDAPATQTKETSTEEDGFYTPPAKNEENPTVTYPTVPEPLTWDRINAIPIANASMSSDELRQICVDYMRLMLSFHWTPSEDVSYRVLSSMHNNKPLEFKAGVLYAGLPYRAGEFNGPSGNLYSAMEIYDPKTGIMQLDGMSSDAFTFLVSNHCSSSCYWAWGRVINSIIKRDSRNLNNALLNKDNGCLPVGPYTYDSVESWKDDGTREVCQKNGEQVMYRSYAAMKPADGLIQLFPKGTSYANHVQMLAVKPEVKYLPDGSIDGENSYLTVLEQTSSPTEKTLADGTKILVEGGIDARFSFKRLFEVNYIPFTFAEFLGQDPVEAGEVKLVGDNSSPANLTELSTCTLESNYPISSVKVSIFEADGSESFTRYLHPSSPGTFRYEMRTVSALRNLHTAEQQGKKIVITTRIATGEELPVFEK